MSLGSNNLDGELRASRISRMKGMRQCVKCMYERNIIKIPKMILLNLLCNEALEGLDWNVGNDGDHLLGVLSVGLPLDTFYKVFA